MKLAHGRRAAEARSIAALVDQVVGLRWQGGCFTLPQPSPSWCKREEARAPLPNPPLRLRRKGGGNSCSTARPSSNPLSPPFRAPEGRVGRGAPCRAPEPAECPPVPPHPLQNLVIPIAQHPKAQALQHFGATLVIRTLLKMLPTIQLDDQPRFKANKVGDVSAQGHLPTEAKTRQLAAPQLLPQAVFGIGRRVAQCPGTLSQLVRCGSPCLLRKACGCCCWAPVRDWLDSDHLSAQRALRFTPPQPSPPPTAQGRG